MVVFKYYKKSRNLYREYKVTQLSDELNVSNNDVNKILDENN